MGGSHFKLPTVGSTSLTWPLQAQSNGTAAAPAFSFAGATGNGMWYQGSNTLGWSTNGALAMTLDASGNLSMAGSIVMPAAGLLKFSASRSTLQSTADGFLMMQNAAGTGFTGLRWGGATASFPMLKASGTTLAARLADDSADAPISASTATLSSFLQYAAATKLLSAADGTLQVTTAAGAFGSVLLGATGATTGMKLVASNGVLTLSTGDGAANSGKLMVGGTAGNTALDIGSSQMNCGEIQIARAGSSLRLGSANGTHLRGSSDTLFGWSSGSAVNVATDTALARSAAAIVKITDGGSNYGKLELGTSVRLQTGSGSPEGVVTSNIGGLYLRTDGGASTTLYIKESGTGNTGWIAK